MKEVKRFLVVAAESAETMVPAWVLVKDSAAAVLTYVMRACDGALAEGRCVRVWCDTEEEAREVAAAMTGVEVRSAWVGNTTAIVREGRIYDTAGCRDIEAVYERGYDVAETLGSYAARLDADAGTEE